MPTYEYRCSKGHHYEQIEGFDAPTQQACPKCGGRAQRQISMPAVIFKGSGFYSTDNRKGWSGNGGSGAASGDAPSKESSGESKAEAATAD